MTSTPNKQVANTAKNPQLTGNFSKAVYQQFGGADVEPQDTRQAGGTQMRPPPTPPQQKGQYTKGQYTQLAAQKQQQSQAQAQPSWQQQQQQQQSRSVNTTLVQHNERSILLYCYLRFSLVL
jgi:hypothetical protein